MSNNLVLQGTITSISEVQTGESKAGKAWKKAGFAVQTDGDYPKTVYFTVFGEEKVDNLLKFNKVGQTVDVSFNAESREYNGKFYTDLQAWKIFTTTKDSMEQPKEEYHDVATDDGMPF